MALAAPATQQKFAVLASPDDGSQDGELSEDSTSSSCIRHPVRHFFYGSLTGATCMLMLLLAIALPGVIFGYILVGRVRAERREAFWHGNMQAAFRSDPAVTQPFTLAGKSVYFLIIDRFARGGAGSDYPACTGVTPRFCGGNIRGITERLDYIQGMGFDCIWITPPVKQYASDSCHVVDGRKWCSDGFSGYWAENFFQIDPHFGTPDDLKELAASLHARRMCLVLDMVTNHAGIIASDADAKRIYPFDKVEYYNQIAGLGTFGKVQGLNASWHQLPDSVTNCGPHNHDYLFCVSWCGPGAYVCPQYDQRYVEQGWFGSLGDLNQSHPFVRRELLRYATGMVHNYSVDAIRLDTAAFMPRDFLAALQKAVGVQIIGEVTSLNMTHQASYQRNPPRISSNATSRSILAGTLNFPVFYYATGAFCGWIPFLGRVGEPNMTNLTMVMRLQLDHDLYEDVELLGNFLDNHDEEARIAKACKNDLNRIKNALTWLMLYRGIPMIYYGTEQGFDSEKDHTHWQGDSTIRESLWQTGYSTSTWQYQFIKRLNDIRKRHRIGSSAEIHSADNPHTMVFVRSSHFGHVTLAWVFVNNYPEAQMDQPVVYCPGPFPVQGSSWIEVLSKDGLAELAGGCYHAPNGEPKVLVLQKQGEQSGIVV